MEEKKEDTFLRCNGRSHNSSSKYPRERVPAELFRKAPDDPNSEFWKNCIDCRRRRAEAVRDYIKRCREKIESKGLLQCVDCMMPFKKEEMATNYDGTKSASCISCKKIKKERAAAKANIYRKIKMEMIEKHECSCYKCKFLFFKPLEGSLIVGRIATYLKEDNKRYIMYEDKEYRASYIIDMLKDDLEIEIIQLDHLSEEEQRERGILKDGEKFIPKKERVSALSSEHSMRLEALRTQNLCIKCHMEESIRREKGKRKSPQEIVKYNYVRELKKLGCVSCGFKDDASERFFEFDHINPDEKTEAIARMVQLYDYSMDDLIKECAKCRIFCAFCHRMHTRNQIRLGLFLPKPPKNTEDGDTETDLSDEDLGS